MRETCLPRAFACSFSNSIERSEIMSEQISIGLDSVFNICNTGTMNKQEMQVVKDVWECKLCDCLTQHFRVCLGLKDVMPETYFNLYKSAQKKHRRQW